MSTAIPQPPNLATNEQGMAARDQSDSRREQTVSCVDSPDLSDIASGSRPIPPHSLFTKQQKIAITVLVSLASVLSPMSATIYVPALPSIAEDLNVSITLINLSVTSYMIFQGLSPSLWGCLTDVIGRRPVYITTLLVYVGACIGLACTENYAELIVFRCLQSTGSASTIAIGAGVIGDITERRERGGFIGVYAAGSLVGNAIGPILGGIFAQKTGWHGIFYFLTALAGFFNLILFLVLPETLRAIVGNGSIKPKRSLLFRPVFSWLTPSGAGSDTSAKPHKHKVDLLGPIKMMGQKDVFCGLIFTAMFYTVWQSALVATATQFESEYGLDEISIGLCFIASGVGCVSGSLLTGKLLNYDYRQAQRKAKPETTNLDRVDTASVAVDHIEHARLKRLPYASIAFLIASVSFGWCIKAHTTIALPIIWTFVTGYTTTMIMSMFSTLIVDWYPDAGASATAAINLARCLLGAGGISVVQPLINKVGVGWTFTIGTAICIASCPLGILVITRGESWRIQREERLRQAEQVRRNSLGMIHKSTAHFHH